MPQRSLTPLTIIAVAHSISAQAGWQASWFGPWPGHPEWADEMNEGKPNASGAPMTTPGIALYDESTLGKWFVVWGPHGKKFLLPQVDVGPAPWTGKSIDINAPAAALMGYTPKTFPTGAEFPYRMATQEEVAAGKTTSDIPADPPPTSLRHIVYVNGSAIQVLPHQWYGTALVIPKQPERRTADE